MNTDDRAYLDRQIDDLTALHARHMAMMHHRQAKIVARQIRELKDKREKLLPPHLG